MINEFLFNLINLSVINSLIVDVPVIFDYIDDPLFRIIINNQEPLFLQMNKALKSKFITSKVSLSLQHEEQTFKLKQVPTSQFSRVKGRKCYAQPDLHKLIMIKAQRAFVFENNHVPVAKMNEVKLEASNDF